MDLVAFVMNIQPTALTLTTQCTDSVEGLRSIRKVSLELEPARVKSQARASEFSPWQPMQELSRISVA
jgi:hypothetical protein